MEVRKDVTWAANQVYNELGPGMTETCYEAALEIELEQLFSAPIRRQVPCPILYQGYVVGTGIIDILIDHVLLIEVKAVNKLSGKEVLQVKKYLKTMGTETAFLINFGNKLEVVEVQTVRLANGKIDYVELKGSHGETSSETN